MKKKWAWMIGAIFMGLLVGALASTGIVQAAPDGAPLLAPVGTAFTYQGYIEDLGSPANGSYNLRFSLWDAPTAGAQAGSTQTKSGVSVVDGVFSVTLDFGAVFDGTALWLAIEVQGPGDPGYTMLSPRQALTPVPYASYANTAPWSGLAGAPWAYFSGSGTSGQIYHSGDVALGSLTDPGGNGLNVQNYTGGRAAVRGADQLGSTIYAEGQLGVLSPSGLPVNVTNVGVLGLKPAAGSNGAAVYGWNNDNNSANYAGIFVANGTGTSNYGIYAAASGASARNVAGYFGGRVGINTTAPTADIHMVQSDGNSSGAGGIRLAVSGGSNWKILHTGLHLSFAENGTRLAYIQTGTGTYVVPSDRALKEGVAPLGSVLDGVMQLNPVTYSYITDPKSTRVNGFIAQEVEAVFPGLVKTDEDGMKGLAYSDFGILAVAAIQEQQAMIESLQRENAMLKADIEAIKSLLGITTPAAP
ncbi:MAG: hypothetical protein BMS9Abin28_2296 [Anaerolineae bacterium]|nr:MAG: hypothetical protein BMS9Abin28_2296 [Anaerolineae bacterium]